MGKIQQLAGKWTRISPVIPFPAPSSGTLGMRKFVSKLSLRSTKNKFKFPSSSAELPRSPFPSEKPMVTCVTAVSELPCGYFVWVMSRNSISGVSVKFGASEQAT